MERMRELFCWWFGLCAHPGRRSWHPSPHVFWWADENQCQRSEGWGGLAPDSGADVLREAQWHTTQLNYPRFICLHDHEEFYSYWGKSAMNDYFHCHLLCYFFQNQLKMLESSILTFIQSDCLTAPDAMTMFCFCCFSISILAIIVMQICFLIDVT